MNKYIRSAVNACNRQEDCIKCSDYYKGLKGDKDYIPCNFIRKKYGVSIHDYK